MALIKCPECEQEVSDLSPCCIHCGYPLNEEQLAKEPTQPKKLFGQKNLLTKKKKIIAISGLIIILLVAYFALFHLGTEEKYAYNLIIENAGDFKSPKKIEVISGTAGWNNEDEEAYAFVCLVSQNGYGAETTGYYCLGVDYVHDCSYEDSLIKLCKKDKLNVGTINRRLAMYWLFH